MQCVQQASHFASLSSYNQIPDRLYINFNRGHYESNGETAPLFQLSSMDELQNLVNCGIDKGSESAEDTYCILDLNEADIAASQGGVDRVEGGIPLEINIPPEMCEFTTWMIPWHWNQPSGYGPANIHECTVTPPESDSDEEGSGGETKTYTSISANGGGPWILNTEDAVGLCERGAYAYDRSDDEGLANCCFGTASKATRECVGTDSTCCSQVARNEINLGAEEEEWGGDARNCIGGPARGSDWGSFVAREDIGEIPTTQITATWQSGMRDNFSIGPAFSDYISSNSVLPVVNYFDGVEDLLFTNGVRGCDNCPSLFFADVNKRSTGKDRLIPTGYPYYTLSCLDSNFEVLHRVHLVVREWNTLEEFLTFQDTEGRSGDPDVTGTEGSDCLYYEADEQLESSTRCNDFWDIDDVNGRVRESDINDPVRILLNEILGVGLGSGLSRWLEYPYVQYD